MIRAARIDDYPRLTAMGLRFVRETEYKNFIEANEQALADMMRRLLSNDNAVVFVLEKSGNICGMFGAHVYLHPMSWSLTGAEAFWWVEPEHRRGTGGIRLLDYGEAWVRSRGAKRMQMIAPNEKVARIYRTRGYRKFEEQYQRDFA